MDPSWRLVHVDDAIWILVTPTGVPAYDFAFESSFPCHHPWEAPADVRVIGRVGAFQNYAIQFAELRAEGMELIHIYGPVSSPGGIH
jgi:hypothetical protein